jgi:hypothetical protein
LRTRPFRSALASSCSSLAALLALGAPGAPARAAAGAQEHPAVLRAVEIEAELAKEPRIYLVLEPRAKTLRVKSRGMELAAIPVRELALLRFSPLFGSGDAPPLEAPAVWTVREGPGDTDRETIAPTELRPYSEEEEMVEPAPAAGGAPQKKPGEAEKPSSYRVALDNGWQLYLVNQSPNAGFLRRFAQAVRDGWLRVLGREPAHPPLIALVVAPEDARRLHHLFRTGMPILVDPPG